MPADQGHDEGFFGERVAATYDERSAGMFDPAVVTPVVDLLAGLAGRGRALEFGIGTGRIALPLAERGLTVAGIDSSEAMVARLRAKPGGEDLEVAIGDFSSTRIGGKFSLVYLIFNTINNLTTQDEQVACFQNVAAHLERGGRFVIEIFQKLTKRNVSMRVLGYLSAAGMILFLGFFLIMVNQDVQRFIFGNWV